MRLMSDTASANNLQKFSLISHEEKTLIEKAKRKRKYKLELIRGCKIVKDYTTMICGMPINQFILIQILFIRRQNCLRLRYGPFQRPGFCQSINHEGPFLLAQLSRFSPSIESVLLCNSAFP